MFSFLSMPKIKIMECLSDRNSFDLSATGDSQQQQQQNKDKNRYNLLTNKADKLSMKICIQ